MAFVNSDKINIYIPSLLILAEVTYRSLVDYVIRSELTLHTFMSSASRPDTFAICSDFNLIKLCRQDMVGLVL